MTARRQPVLIAGPTAGGKSALALRLAAERDGVIINADSMQVYAELAVLTARPSADDIAAAPHRLYGHVPGAADYSVGRWLDDVAREITTATAAGATPIVVGGTGLYFKALLEGLAPVPPVPDEVRTHMRALAQALPPGELHGLLAERDPVIAAKLDPGDTQRITRALEVFEATGRSLLEWQRLPGKPVLRLDACEALVAAPEREVVYARCDARLAVMFERGAIGEVEALLRQGLAADRPVMRAVGVRPIALHLAGVWSREQALEQARLDTRHYVKRQLTWLRRHMMAWNDYN